MAIRAFKVDQYVKTADGFTGYIYAAGNQYEVAICERDEVRQCSASDLTSWRPKNGERVVEAGNTSRQGIVVEAGEDISLVRWTGLLRQVSFVNSCLQPAWTD